MSSPLDSLFHRPINFEALLKANDITPQVQRHLANVYAALAGTVLVCALGAIMDLSMHLGGIGTTLAGLGTLLWLQYDQDKTNYTKRIGILLLFGLLQGFSLGPLVNVAMQVDPSIIVTSLLATTMIFGCFAGAAILSKRRSYLYLSGLLSSAISVLLLTSIANVFMRSAFLFGVHLYIGLAFFCGYVVFDTQMIVEKASAGNKDYPWHAAELFIDFVAIFVRICIILIRKSENRRSRKSRDGFQGKARR